MTIVIACRPLPGQTGAMEESSIRVSDAERESARSTLADHMAAGRITMEEYDERSDALIAAKTRGEVARLFTDLPEGESVLVPASGPGSPAPVAHPRGREFGERLMAVSGSLALVAFFVLGFAFHAWAWAWVVFVLPGIAAGLFGLEKKR